MCQFQFIADGTQSNPTFGAYLTVYATTDGVPLPEQLRRRLACCMIIQQLSDETLDRTLSWLWDDYENTVSGLASSRTHTPVLNTRTVTADSVSYVTAKMADAIELD